MKAFMKLKHGQRELGVLHFELYEEDVPKTVDNFKELLREKYLGCPFHRIIPGFMAQGGDFTNGNGTGGESIFGQSFADENFRHRHTRPGMLSMANSGPDTNGSQFFITFKAVPHLDGKHVVFGHVDVSRSDDVLNQLERVRTDGKDVPLERVTVVDCGVVDESMVELSEKATMSIDDDEIELEEEVDDPNPAIEEEEMEEPKTKAQAMRQRLRKLKQKMNQARQLNKQAVKEEGERISDVARDRRRQAIQQKKAQTAAWEASNAKALALAKEAGIDPKALTEQASDSVRTARKRADKAETNEYQINDYHNPEGQHRNYQRNLKSVHRTNTTEASISTDTYNPLDTVSTSKSHEADQREGARRVAAELKRRMVLRQEREAKRKPDDTASGINKRNKRFNEKINRTYDKQTAEIRQNLERGTAL